MAHIPGHAVAPPTGLIGSELALRGGFTGGIGALQQGGLNTRNLLTQGFGQQIGLAEGALGRGLAGANILGGQAQDVFSGAQQQGLNLTSQALQPFAGPGGAATNLLGAFSGASGAPAQAQAFANFQQDPLQQFLQQQGEQSVLRNASALGGLGGGNLPKDLIRFGQGNALQGLNTQLNLLGNLSGQGLQAAGQQAGLGANLIGQFGLARGQGLQQQGQNILGTGQVEAANRLQFAQPLLSQGAGSFERQGQNISNIFTGTGRDLAGGRTQAGEQIFQAIGTAGQGISNLISQQGTGLGNIIGAGGSNLAQLINQAGTGAGISQQDLAAILANISTGQGSNVAGLPGVPGIQETGGQLDLASTIAAITTFLSDERLKTNIIKIGQTSAGTNVYKWNWTQEAKFLVGDQPAVGVIAQEILETQPEAVIMVDGFYRVNYARIH